jgi:S-formylglutathione hydrolase FrmB
MVKKPTNILLFLFSVILFFSDHSYAQKGILHIAREKNLSVVKHDSKILGKEKTFRIFLPEKGEADSPFPVLYVLHGVLCHSEAWPEQTEIEDLGNDYQMILVFPDGENSWYVDSPIKPDMQYESYIIKELIPFIEHNFPARPGRNSRAIIGASMGGHGAITLAEKYPDLFCSVSSFFGILKLSDERTIKSNLVGPFLTELLGPYNKNKKRWRANSAYELAENFINKDIAIFIDWGNNDVTPAKQNNQDFHRRLNELGIPHLWKERYGGHTSDFLNTHLKEHLDFHWGNLTSSINN